MDPMLCERGVKNKILGKRGVYTELALLQAGKTAPLLPRDADEHTCRSGIQSMNSRHQSAAHMNLRHSSASSDPFAMSWLYGKDS